MGGKRDGKEGGREMGRREEEIEGGREGGREEGKREGSGEGKEEKEGRKGMEDVLRCMYLLLFIYMLLRLKNITQLFSHTCMQTSLLLSVIVCCRVPLVIQQFF